MNLIRDIRAKTVDALVKANDGVEDVLRPAMEARKEKTLCLNSMGLTNLAGLSEYPYLENLYLRKTPLSASAFWPR